MSVTDETLRDEYLLDETTVEFPITFPFLGDVDYLSVLSVNETTGNITPRVWSLSGENLILDNPGPAGDRLVILPDIPATQTLELEVGAALSSANLERALDKLTLLCGQLKAQVQSLLDAEE